MVENPEIRLPEGGVASLEYMMYRGKHTMMLHHATSTYHTTDISTIELT